VQIPKVQKSLTAWLYFLRFCDLHALKLRVKCWEGVGLWRHFWTTTSLPVTVTVNEHFLVFPDKSVAPTLIWVVPILNFVADVNAGMLTTLGLYPELSERKLIIRINTTQIMQYSFKSTQLHFLKKNIFKYYKMNVFYILKKAFKNIFCWLFVGSLTAT